MPIRFGLLTLKLFVAVVEEQSIARAAGRENLVAPRSASGSRILSMI
jgi:DNA-binding transcriptional LysR family regulator